MKRIKITSGWIIPACLTGWGLFLTILVLPVLNEKLAALRFGIVPFLLLAVMILSFASVIIVLRGYSTRNAKEERLTKSPLARILSLLIIAALIVSTYASIKSLWLSPYLPPYHKFVYENTATGLTFGSFVVMFWLSALQKDIYWITRRRNSTLDERQLMDRQQIFETSYKLGALAVLVFMFFFVTNLTSYNVEAIIHLSTFRTMPGQLFYPGYNLVIGLFALPLILAAWKKQ